MRVRPFAWLSAAVIVAVTFTVSRFLVAHHLWGTLALLWAKTSCVAVIFAVMPHLATSWKESDTAAVDRFGITFLIGIILLSGFSDIAIANFLK